MYILFRDWLMETGKKDNILNDNNNERFLEMMKSKANRPFITIFPLRIDDSEFSLTDAIHDALLNGMYILASRVNQIWLFSHCINIDQGTIIRNSSPKFSIGYGVE
jgi:hypothetical protein